MPGRANEKPMPAATRPGPRHGRMSQPGRPKKGRGDGGGSRFFHNREGSEEVLVSDNIKAVSICLPTNLTASRFSLPEIRTRGSQCSHGESFQNADALTTGTSLANTPVSEIDHAGTRRPNDQAVSFAA